MSRQGKLRKVLTRTAYGLGFALLMVIGLELMFRAVAFDPFYYWEYRFQYISPNSLENRSEGVWTYRPNTAIREVSVYGLPQLTSTQPTLAIEFDCPMRSNNLGLLQDNDIAPGTPVTLVLATVLPRVRAVAPGFPGCRRSGRRTACSMRDCSAPASTSGGACSNI